MAETSFSIFKRRNANSSDEDDIFDESCFDFKLIGGPYQSQLIEASATYKKGKNAGLPLPLHCSWFKSTSKVDFTPIEGVLGAFYQPNVEDVGCKICVHAVPPSDIEEYTGMPAFQEVGPLQIDPDIEGRVQKLMAEGNGTFDAYYRGNPVQINITAEALSITKQGSQIAMAQIDGKFPSCKIDAKSSVDYCLTMSSEQKYTIQANNNQDRDVLAMVLKILNGAKLDNQDESSNGNALQMNSYVKIEQLSKALEQITQDKDALATKFINAESSLNTITTDYERVSTELHQYQTHNTVLQTEIGRLSRSWDASNQQTQFYLQEIALYKKQAQKLERKLAKFEENRDEKIFLTQVLAKSQDEDSELNEIIQNFMASQIQLSRLSSTTPSEMADPELPLTDDFVYIENEKYEICKITIAAYFEEWQTQMLLNTELRAQIEKIECERNFYKKKWESIQIENDKLLTRLGKNPTDVSQFTKEKEIFAAERAELAREKQFMQVEIETYKQSMLAAKRKLEEEMKRRQQTTRPTGAGTNEQLFLLVNALTQTVTERDLALETQRGINRQLINKTIELESLLDSVRIQSDN